MSPAVAAVSAVAALPGPFGSDTGSRVLCKKPYMRGVTAFGCGQCMPCRLNRRRVWTARQTLESFGHAESCFVTLTYDEEHVPAGGSLVPEDFTKWMKRFRKAYGRPLRYFMCGEYGDQTWRPHYHASLFGVGQSQASLVQSTWRQGFTMTAEFTEATAQYVSGYVVKKMTDPALPVLQGRYPEYARMSRRPGLGVPALSALVTAVCSEYGVEEIEAIGDVPMSVNIGRKSWPLGRLLRQKLREEVGFTEEYTQAISDRYVLESTEEMLRLREAHGDNSSFLHKNALVQENIQKVRNLEGRAKLKRKINL